MVDKLTRQETEKYTKIWELDRYRERSPGVRFVQRAKRELCVQHRDTICDWGIGTGRAANLWEQEGLKAFGVDIAPNACTEFKGKVWLGSIWEDPLPKEQLFNFAYCTDVMEHIPPNRVLDTLKVIKKHTMEMCWFSIANFPDSEGSHIGETLHLSVRPPEWWAGTFARVFPHFHFSAERKHFIVVAYVDRKDE